MALLSIQVFTGNVVAPSPQNPLAQGSATQNTPIAAGRLSLWCDVAKLIVPFAVFPPAVFLVGMLYVMGHSNALFFFTPEDILSYAPVAYFLDAMVLLFIWLVCGLENPLENLRFWGVAVFIVAVAVSVVCGYYAFHSTKNYKVSLTGESTPKIAAQAFPLTKGLLLITGSEMQFIPWVQIRQVSQVDKTSQP